MKKILMCLLLTGCVIFTSLQFNVSETYALTKEQKSTFNEHKSTFSWGVGGDMGSEDPGSILPNTEDHHVFQIFKLDFPTGAYQGGGGIIKLQNHYFDAEEQYGYPPAASIEMFSDVIADFEADLVAVDDWGIHHAICSGAYQTYNYYDDVVLRTANTGWSDMYGHYSACDDEGEATMYDYHIERS